VNDVTEDVAGGLTVGPPVQREEDRSGGFDVRNAAIALAPTATLVSFCVALLAVFNISVFDSLAYLGYELAYAVIPGTLAVLAVTGSRRVGLQEVALGVGVGYGLELLAFVVTAATGTRGVFPWYPLIATVLSVPWIRARVTVRAGATSTAPSWSLVALMAVLAGFLANSILDTPLPRQISSLGGYPFDMLWSTSVTAEAINHWPLQVPGFVGHALHYHYFVYLHLAGASRVTGIDPWTLNFRLFPLWATLVTAFELYAVGRALRGRAATGLLAAFLLLLAGNFFPWPQAGNDITQELYLSVTFAFGLIVWLPLLLAMWLTIVRREAQYRQGSTWVLLLGLLIVAAGAKAPVDIVAGSGVALLAAWQLVRDRRALPATLATGALTALVFAAGWAVLYRTTNGAVTLRPFGAIKHFQPFELISHHVPGSILWAFWLVVAVLMGVKVLAALLPGIAASIRWLPSTDVVFLVAPLLAGMIFFFAFTNVGNSQNYFEWYGAVAGAILAGAGLAEAGARFIRPVRLPSVVLAATVCVLLLAWTFESPVDPAPKPVWQNLTHSAGTQPEYTGFHWVATHTQPSDVIAVDARSLPSDCFQTAFAERRAIVDCYFGFAPEESLTSVGDLQANLPSSLFQDVQRRVELNAAIFRGDAKAIATARRSYALRYVVVDLLSGGTRAELVRLGRVSALVFRNPAVAVFRVGTR
jgi:hypothetical protein